MIDLLEGPCVFFIMDFNMKKETTGGVDNVSIENITLSNVAKSVKKN